MWYSIGCVVAPTDDCVLVVALAVSEEPVALPALAVAVIMQIKTVVTSNKVANCLER